jgi:hypothetical protein
VIARGDGNTPIKQLSVMDVITQPTDKTDKEYLGYTGPAGVAGATIKGLDDVGRGVGDALTGAWNAVRHPIDTAKSIASLPQQAAQVPAAIHDINQSADPTGSYLQAAQDTASQGAGQALTAIAASGIPKAAGAVSEAIPSASRAGAALSEVKSAAASVPIDMSKVGNTAMDIYTQSQRGAQLPQAVGKLIRRVTAPDSAPLTYEEAKDFQSNISRLSANEQMRLNPNTKRLVGQLNQDLKGSLQDAADTVGKGQQFQQAMKEYHHAMQLKGFSEAAIDAAWKAALTGVGLYGAKKVIEAVPH